MNFETASAKYLELRKEHERIDREAKAQKAEITKIMNDIENWFALRAQEEGLENIKTPTGTVYWSTVSSASVADPQAFRDYVFANKAYDLLETRVSKTATKSFIEANGAPPPGVNFSTFRSFNLRAAGAKE